jgi:TIR domain
MVRTFPDSALAAGTSTQRMTPRAVLAHWPGPNLTVSRPKVVISYAQPDWDLARELMAHVEAQGIACWIAGRDVPFGADRATEIVNAIATARAMVLVFSASANSSTDVRREVERAFDRGVPLLPFRIADVAPSSSLEYFLSGQNFLDAYPPPLAPHYARLCACLDTILASSAGATQPSDTTLPPTPAPHASEVRPLHVEAESLRHLESELAARIGPFAEYAVRHAADAVSDIDALLDQLGEHIDSETERQEFVSSCRQWLHAAGGAPVAQGAPQATTEAPAERAGNAQPELVTASNDGSPEMRWAPSDARSTPAEASESPAEASPRPQAPSAAPGSSAVQPHAAVDENVQFTVFRPRELVPDEWQPLLAFAHLASERSDIEVKRQAEAVLKHAIAEYRQVVQDAQDAVPRDEVLTLVPRVPGVEFEPAERGFPCRGTVHLEVFLARALPQLPAQTARGKLSVHLGTHAIAELPLTMSVAAPRNSDAARAQS